MMFRNNAMAWNVLLPETIYKQNSTIRAKDISSSSVDFRRAFILIVSDFTNSPTNSAHIVFDYYADTYW